MAHKTGNYQIWIQKFFVTLLIKRTAILYNSVSVI